MDLTRLKRNNFRKIKEDMMVRDAETMLVFPVWDPAGGNTPSGILEGDGKGGVKPGSLAVDAVPTEGSDNPVKSGGVYAALENKADKADAVLSPIYSQTPTFSEWTISPPANVELQWTDDSTQGWIVNGWGDFVVAGGTEDSTSLSFTGLDDVDYTATRTRSDIVGYTLGSQSNKPLATAAQGAKADTAYQKPSGGIPATDMASAVQDSLQKADNALSRQEAEDGFTEWRCDPPTINGKVCSVVFDDGFPAWVLCLDGEPTSDTLNYPEDETRLVFDDNYSVTATRTRLPTMADLDDKASLSRVPSASRAALQALTELDATTDLQATKDTINTLMKVLKALVPAASAVFMFVLSALGVDSLNSMNPTNLVYTAGEVDKLVYTQALSRAEAEEGFTEWMVTPDVYLGYSLSVSWLDDCWNLLFNGEAAPLANPLYEPDDSTGLTFRVEGTADVQATRIRLRPTPEMEASWDAKASMNDVELVPVYSDGTPAFSKWVCSPQFFHVVQSEHSSELIELILYDGDTDLGNKFADPFATSVQFIPGDDISGIDDVVTATRTRTDIIGYTLGNQTNSVMVSTNALEKYASTNDVQLVPVFTAWTILRDGTDVTAQVRQPEWLGSLDALMWKVYVLPSEVTDGPVGQNPLSVSLSWTAFVSGSSEEVPYTATRSVAAYHMAGQSTKDMATPDGVAKAISDAEAEAKQWVEWFPDGTVTSYDQCTQDLKFDWANATNNAVKVLAFATDGVTPSNGEAVGDIVIPPYIDHEGTRYTVTAIGDYGNQGPPSGAAITSLKAPTTVTQIGYGAFYYCTSLTSASFPAATSIGNGAFDNCASLTSVSLPAATSIGNDAFNYCTSLTSVSLPAATTIGNSAFFSCSSLTLISFPVVTNIGLHAFYYCTNLTSVSFPAATSIGNGAFDNCTSLTSVDFGPATRQSPPSLGSDAFSTLSGHTCRIIVPDGNYDAWIADQNWFNLTSQGYQFTKYGGTYLKDANGIYWELTVGTDGVLGATAATNIVNAASE